MQLWKKQLININLASLILLGLYLLFRSVVTDQYVNFIYWPGGFFASVALFSTLLIQYSPFFNQFSFHQILRFLGLGIIFSLAVMVFSDILVLILERFFRFDEHLKFSTILSHWVKTGYRIVEGLFMYVGYMVLIWLFRTKHMYLESLRKTAFLETKVEQLEVEKMQFQLNPHFLYNAMNSVVMMIRTGAYKKSIEMIVNLNELLRTVLHKAPDQLIPVQEEVQLLSKYLQIESLRFGDHVKVNMDIQQLPDNAKIPRMLLQPLVENAFKHGMLDNVAEQEIHLSLQPSSEHLNISIYNSVVAGVNKTALITKRGIGLENTIHRLRRIYGNRFLFQQEMLSGGLNLKITIPQSG